MRVDRLWTNGRIASLREGLGPYGALEPAALAARDGRIAWVGPLADLPDRVSNWDYPVGYSWLPPMLPHSTGPRLVSHARSDD